MQQTDKSIRGRKVYRRRFLSLGWARE